MRKRSLILFIILLVFGLILATNMDIQHILAGTFLALITVWFWQDLGPRLPSILTAKQLLLLGRCLSLLVWYVIEANISVARELLVSGSRVNPTFIVMQPGIKSNWGRILLATCITITPGTVTIDINPDTGQFIVHALTEETGADLSQWRMIDEIKTLEANL